MNVFEHTNLIKVRYLISEIKSFLKSSYWLTPLNLNEEKLRVLENRNYNPKFIYPKMPVKNIKRYIEKINSFRFVSKADNIETIILERKIKELSLKLQLLLARGSEDITKFSSKLYDCKFDKEHLAQAKKDSEIDTHFEKREDLSEKKLVEEVRKYLAKYDLYDWDLILSNSTDFYIRIKPVRRIVYISERINWDFTNLDNTLAHEIDGHVLRAVNAQKQKKKIFRLPLPFYLKTEEGLASFLGDFCSTASEVSRKHHALKYLAGNLALTESFNKVNDFLVSYGFTRELALQRTFRLKRGFEETSLPGCYMKEAVYYEGMLEVKEYIDKGNNVEKLYSGKFGLRDLEYVIAVDPLIIPERLKKYLDTH